MPRIGTGAASPDSVAQQAEPGRSEQMAGKVEIDRGGEPLSFDWDAKREKK